LDPRFVALFFEPVGVHEFGDAVCGVRRDGGEKGVFGGTAHGELVGCRERARRARSA
jgi:hypothetical protein